MKCKHRVCLAAPAVSACATVTHSGDQEHPAKTVGGPGRHWADDLIVVKGLQVWDRTRACTGQEPEVSQPESVISHSCDTPHCTL